MSSPHPQESNNIAIPPTVAETFWQMEELRYELFQWELPRAQLAEMMVLEKRSLLEVVKGLYKHICIGDMAMHLRERECPEVSPTAVRT